MSSVRELYHPVSIGRTKIAGNLFLAPIAGYSDAAFRSVCRSRGADFTYTEMVSSQAIVRKNIKTEALLVTADNERTFAVQIFGSDPIIMAAAARAIINKAAPSCIDINAGCPVPKITKTGAGSALMRNPEQLFKVVRAVVQAGQELGVSVTVKMRSGWVHSELTFREAAVAALDAGAAALTIHPRTRAQGYAGDADHTVTAELVSLAKPYGVPVFASGDIFTPEDARAVLEHTNADGIMFARGAMGNPFIFEQTKDLLQKGTYAPITVGQKLETGLTELQILGRTIGEFRACRTMRKRFLSYTKGFRGGAALRQNLIEADTIQQYIKITNDYLATFLDIS